MIIGEWPSPLVMFYHFNSQLHPMQDMVEDMELVDLVELEATGALDEALDRALDGARAALPPLPRKNRFKLR